MEQLTKLTDAQSTFQAAVQKQSAEKEAGAFESLMQGLGRQSQTKSAADRSQSVVGAKQTKAKVQKKSTEQSSEAKSGAKEAAELTAAAVQSSGPDTAAQDTAVQSQKAETTVTETEAVEAVEQDALHMQRVAEMQMDLASQQRITAAPEDWQAKVPAEEIDGAAVQVLPQGMQPVEPERVELGAQQVLMAQNAVQDMTAAEPEMPEAAAKPVEPEAVMVTAQPVQEEVLPQGMQPVQSTAQHTEPESENGEPESGSASLHAGAAVVQVTQQAREPEEIEAPKTEVLQTSAAKLVEDMTDMLQRQTAMNQRAVQIELNPGNLGKVLIHVNYELGRTVISIMASKQETLHLLTQNAAQMGHILSRNTGEETTVVVAQQTSADTEQQGAETETEARSQNRREADEGRQKNRQNQSDTFLNMMRLGMM